MINIIAIIIVVPAYAPREQHEGPIPCPRWTIVCMVYPFRYDTDNLSINIYTHIGYYVQYVVLHFLKWSLSQLSIHVLSIYLIGYLPP